MAKKVQLLTTDLKQEVLHPETTSDMVQHGGSTLDVELGKKLGKTEKAADSSLLNGVVAQILPIISTIVQRNTSGNIDVFNAINFHDLSLGNGIDETFTGSITMNPTNRKLYHAYIPPGQTGQANSTSDQIHTQRELPVSEGTWTPSFVGASGGGIANYTTRDGRWYRQGNLVTITCRIIGTGKSGTFNGDIRITGLPFVNRGITSPVTIGTALGINNFSTNRQIGANVANNGAVINFVAFNINNGNDRIYLNSAHLTGDANPSWDFMLAATYEVA